MGYPCKPYVISLYDYGFVAVKAPIFSFTRLRGADPTLGVEMSSTGEVACFGKDVHEAFLQALLASNFNLPKKSPDKYILISLAEEKMRIEFTESLRLLVSKGYQIAATPGTAQYYLGRGFPEIVTLAKPDDSSPSSPGGSEMTVLKWIANRKIDLVINIPEGTMRSDEVTAGYKMRRYATDFGTSLLTNIKCAVLFCEALTREMHLPCKSAEDFVGATHSLFG